MADYSVDVKVKLDVQDIQNAVNAKPITATIIPKITFNNNIDGNDLKSVKDAVQRYFQEDANRVGLRFKEDERFLQKDLDRIQSAINKVSSINIKTKLDVDDFQKFRQDIEIIKDSLSGLTSKTITLRFASPDKVELDGIIKSIEEHFRSTPINLTFSRPENNPNSLNLAIGFNQDHLNQFQTALDAIEKIVKEFPAIQVGIDFQKDQYLSFIDGINALEEMNKKFPALEVNITTNNANLELLKNQIEEYFKNNPVNLNFQTALNGQESTASVQNTFNQLNQDIQNTFNQLNQTLQNITNNVQNITNNIDNSVNNTTRNVQNNTLEIDNSINNTTRNVQNNTLRIGDVIRNTLDQSNRQYNTFDNSINVRLNQTTRYIQNNIQRINNDVEHANNHANNLLNTLMQYFGITRIIGAVQNSFQRMVQEVRDLDVELTEFSKVTDLSAQETEKFIDSAYRLGDTVARTGTEVVKATTLFKKMGYEVGESMKFAEDALMWTNVADGMVSVENAATMLISTMKAFEEQGVSSTHVIDALNEVSNNYSTSSSALSENLSVVAATLATSGTSFEQMVGLMTAGIEIMPDRASKVANGLKTISQRIRQIEGDTADKLDTFFREKGISRFDEMTGQLRGTYDILYDVSKIWGTLTENEKQFIGETMAGKNQITVLNALMMNFSTAINATETALNSAGSAARENERVLDSIQGHIQRFQSAFEELSYNLINSGVFKQVVDFGTNLIKILVEITSHTSGLIALIGSGVGITVLNTIQRFNAGFQQAQQQVLNFNNALMEAQQHGQNLDQTLRDIPTRGEYFRNLVGDVQLLTAEIGIGISLVTALYQHYQNLYQERKKEFQDNINNRNKEADLIKQLKNLEQEYLETDIKDTEKRNQLFQKIYDKKVEIANLDNDGLSRTELLNGAIGQQNQLYDNQLVKVAKTTLELERQKQILEEVNEGNLWDKFLGLFPNSPQNQENLNPFGDAYNNEFFGGKNYQDFIDTTSISLQDKIDTLNSLQEHVKEIMDTFDPGTEYYDLYRRQYEFLGEKIEELKEKNEGILSSSKAIAQTVLGDLSTYTEEQLKAMGEVFDAYSNFGISGAEGLQSALENLVEVFGSDLEDNFLQEIQDNLSDPDVAQAASDLINIFLMLQEQAKNASSQIEHNFSYAMGEVLEIYTNTTTELQAQYDILAQAIDEFNESGVITKETLQSLTENDLLQYLEIVNGELVLNEKDFYGAADAALSKASADIDEKVNAEIAAMANDMLTQSLNNVANATTGASQGIDNASGAASDAVPDFMNATSSAEVTALALEYVKSAGENVEIDTSGLEKFQIEAQKLIDSANELKGKLGSFAPSASRGSSSSRSGGSGSSSSRSSTSTADREAEKAQREAEKAQREAEQAAKNAQKAWKDGFDALYKELKTYLDMGAITEAEYYDALETLVDKFYKDREGYEEEYWKYHDEIVKGRKKYLEDQMADLLSKGETLLERQLEAEVISQEEYFDQLEALYRTYYTDQEELEEKLWEIQKQRYEYQIQEIDKQIKAYEDQMSNLFSKGETLLERQLDANIISQEEYFDKLETLYRTYYTDQEELEEHLWEIQKQRYEYQLEEIDKQIKAYEDELNSLFNKGESLLKHQLEMDEITEDEYLDLLENFYKSTITDQEELEEKLLDIKERRYKREKQKNEEHLKELEKQLEDYYNQAKQMHDDYVESLEEDAEGIDAVISYAIDVLDEEIAKLEEEKKALDESNNALEEQIKLQELEDKLQQAKNRKVRVYRKGQGFVYEQDTKAISEAQSAIDKYKQEIAHKKEISMIDERIKELQKYKEAWSNIPKEYQKSQVRLLAMQQATSDSQKKILNGDQQFIDSFTKKYNETQDKLQAANKRNIDEINDFIFGTEEGAGLKQKIEEINAEIEKVKNIDVGARFKTGTSGKDQLENIINRIETLNSTDPNVSPIAALNQQKIELQAEWKETNDVTDLDSILLDINDIKGRINNLNKQKIQLQVEWKKTNDTQNQYETILNNISNIQTELNKIKVKDLNITNWCDSIDKMIKELEELTQAAENASKAGIDVEEITSGNDDKPSDNNNNNNNFKAGDKVILTEEGRKYIIEKSGFLANLSAEQQSAYLDRDLYLWDGGKTGQRIGTKTEPVWDIPWESKYITHASGSSSSGNSSNDDAIPIDDDDIYVPPQWASGTLGTSSKTFMINEKGVEAMVTPEGTVISAPTPGYGVIKNEYTERLTDFASDPLSFLSKTFSGYSGTYQNNTSKSEVININGNLTLPNVTDGMSFIDSIKTVALQYTTRRN